VDGAQLVPHSKVNLGRPGEPGNIDFLAFSAHKMYAPYGTGVLIGPKEVFMNGAPDYAGGGTVKYVTHDYVGWDDPPEKDEAGSPNVIGAVALMASIYTLNNIGMENIEEHEKQLTSYALSRLKEIPEVILYDRVPIENRVGIIPFNIKGISYDRTSELLSDLGGVATRCGCFCAQPYVQRLLRLSPEQVKNYINNPDIKRPGMVRISFGLYNTIPEIDIFIAILKRIIQNQGVSL
jgi:selenocysteine lyase/cysteine desulfurase